MDKQKIEEMINEISDDFDKQGFTFSETKGKEIFKKVILSQLNLIHNLKYNNHFCGGEKVWQPICKECQTSQKQRKRK